MTKRYQGDFLWPFDDGSIEEAGFEFANSETEEYQKELWGILVKIFKDSA